MFDWGDGTYSEWIVLGESDPYISQTHSWSDYGEYEVRVKYKNAYLKESPWSSPLIVIMAPHADADKDGLSNEIEESFEHDSKDNSSIETIFIGNKFFYILDTNDDGFGDILYDTQTDLKTEIKVQDGLLYLDIDGDGSWDYTYDGELFAYAPFPWLQVILGVVGAILIIIAILLKTGIIYVYSEEVSAEE